MSVGVWMNRALRRAPGAGGETGEGWPLSARLRAAVPLLLAVAFFAALAAIGASMVTLKLRELEAGQALGELHQAREAAETERQRLDLELRALRRPDRVLPIAHEKLKLRPVPAAQNGAVPP